MRLQTDPMYPPYVPHMIEVSCADDCSLQVSESQRFTMTKKMICVINKLVPPSYAFLIDT